MSVLETICKRRSIRKYQERQISREDLEKIIEAGTYGTMFCPAWLCKRQLSRAKAEKGRKKQNHRMIRDWR